MEHSSNLRRAAQLCYTFDMTKEKTIKVYTVYAEKDDMTFIITEDTEKKTLAVTGFYFGEPNEEATKEFNNKPLIAQFE